MKPIDGDAILKALHARFPKKEFTFEHFENGMVELYMDKKPVRQGTWSADRASITAEKLGAETTQARITEFLVIAVQSQMQRDLLV